LTNYREEGMTEPTDKAEEARKADEARRELKIQRERRFQSVMLSIATAAVLWALQATIESRTDLADIKPRINAIEVNSSGINARIDSVEKRIERIDLRVHDIEGALDRTDHAR
jgi:hypothetical protein